MFQPFDGAGEPVEAADDGGFALVAAVELEAAVRL